MSNTLYLNESFYGGTYKLDYEFDSSKLVDITFWDNDIADEGVRVISVKLGGVIIDLVRLAIIKFEGVDFIHQILYSGPCCTLILKEEDDNGGLENK